MQALCAQENEKAELMELIGGYRIPYNPKPALERLKTERDDAMEELWENLFHQGDVGSASYAAVPTLVTHGELSLVSAIEIARNEAHNPELPETLSSAYFSALKEAISLTPRDEEQYQGYYVIHASINGQKNLAKALFLLSVEEVINEYS